MSSIIAYPTPKERTIQLKVSTDYAIRIVYYLALKGDTATSGEISGQMGIPQSVIATLAKPLQKAGILTT